MLSGTDSQSSQIDRDSKLAHHQVGTLGGISSQVDTRTERSHQDADNNRTAGNAQLDRGTHPRNHYRNTSEEKTQDNAYEDEFAAYLGIDPKEEDIMFDTSIQILDNSMDDTTYTSVMKLSAYTAAGDLDVMVTDTASFRKYANSECFFDLRTILTDEQLVKYEPYFYYVDQKIIDEINTISDNPDRLDELDNIVYPDPTRPEEMETPIPVGIYLDNSQKLRDNFYFRGQDGTAEHIAIGIYVNTSHLENALKFLEFAFEE